MEDSDKGPEGSELTRTRPSTYGHLDECTFRNPLDTSCFVLAVTHATASYGWGNIRFWVDLVFVFVSGI